jgi:protein-S-isoprenylcysteine O-methyltransferase Ste14
MVSTVQVAIQVTAELALFAVHLAFWGAFGITLFALRDRATTTPAAKTPEQPVPTARYSRALIGLHMVAFGVMYFGLFNAVLGNRVPELFRFQRVVGAAVILFGSFMMCWARIYFRSWRFRAKLDAGHELATGGPFAIVRHPIYFGLNMLAIGSALWVPTVFSAVAVVLMILGSDLRGRAEERLLTGAFGDRYREYMRKTKRFVPGAY